MILKFLYQMNENNKRIITGLVEDDNYLEYDPLYEYPMILDDGYEPKENERVVYNFGEQYYVYVSKDFNDCKVLNINDYLLKVKLDMSSNVVFAASISKHMMEAILENTNYFNMDPYEFKMVKSGLFLCKNKEFKDKYDGWFRKVTDDVYCQFFKDGHVLYLSSTGLTDDFEKAIRISKRECRNYLIINGFINENMQKREVAFSHLNIFTNGWSYGFAGRNSFLVEFENAKLRISNDFIPNTSFKLINDKIRADILRNICYLRKKEYCGKKRCLIVNGKYVLKDKDGSYLLTNEAQSMSLLDLVEIDIIKESFKLYIEDCQFEVVEKSEHYLYCYDNNIYELSSNQIPYVTSKRVSLADFNLFKEAFVEQTPQRKLVLTSNDYYIKYIPLSEDKFQLSFSVTAFDATRFSYSEAKALKNVLGLPIKNKEIDYIFQADKIYNIKRTDFPYTIKEAYESFLLDMNESNIRMNDYIEPKEIKTESDKGAFEYLRRFYLKTLFDSFKLFSSILKNEKVNTILLTGHSATSELIGLSLACEALNKNVDVTTLENNKWGYYPKAYISSKVRYMGSYRLPLAALPRQNLNEFDVIYFGKNTNEPHLSEVFETIKQLDKPMLLAHSNFSRRYKDMDIFEEALSNFISISKRIISSDEREFTGLDTQIGISIIDKNSTYVSLVRCCNNKFIDLLKK